MDFITSGDKLCFNTIKRWKRTLQVDARFSILIHRLDLNHAELDTFEMERDFLQQERIKFIERVKWSFKIN